MHTHTSPCSRCGRLTPEELAQSLADGGYQGAVLTNHFKGGNSGIDRSLPWEKFVEAYENDYLACKKAAAKYDLDIIFGVEEHISGGLEILVYGITPDVLYDNPILDARYFDIWYRVMHEAGAIVIQAHPYRKCTYIPKPQVINMKWIDGIEVYNASNAPEYNEAADKFARAHPGIILTSGADAHTRDKVCASGIEFEERITNEKELVRALRLEKYELIL